MSSTRALSREVESRATPSTAQDEAAIRNLIEAMRQAWARGDGEAYVAAFTDDADYVVFDGTQLHGKQEIAVAHAPLWSGLLRGSRLLMSGLRVRFVTPDVAIVSSRGAVLKWYERNASKRAVCVQTLVAVRKDGAWKLESFQNTRYRPFAGSLFGRLLAQLSPHVSR